MVSKIILMLKKIEEKVAKIGTIKARNGIITKPEDGITYLETRPYNDLTTTRGWNNVLTTTTIMVSTIVTIPITITTMVITITAMVTMSETIINITNFQIFSIAIGIMRIGIEKMIYIMTMMAPIMTINDVLEVVIVIQMMMIGNNETQEINVTSREVYAIDNLMKDLISMKMLDLISMKMLDLISMKITSHRVELISMKVTSNRV